jgi:hypothetical protein
VVEGAPVFLKSEVGLHIWEDKEAVLGKELVEVKGTLRIVNLLLQHATQVLNINVCVLDHLVGSLANKDYPLRRLHPQDVNQFEDKLRLYWEKHLCALHLKRLL